MIYVYVLVLKMMVGDFVTCRLSEGFCTSTCVIRTVTLQVFRIYMTIPPELDTWKDPYTGDANISIKALLLVLKFSFIWK